MTISTKHEEILQETAAPSRKCNRLENNTFCSVRCAAKKYPLLQLGGLLFFNFETQNLHLTFDGPPVEHQVIPFGKGFVVRLQFQTKIFVVPDIDAQDNFWPAVCM